MKKYLFIALIAFLAVTSASAQLRIKMGKNSPIEKLGRAEIAITNLYLDSVDENKLGLRSLWHLSRHLTARAYDNHAAPP